MNTFVNDFLQVPDSLTENGAATFSTSLNFHVDLFFKLGASRGQTAAVTDMFGRALADDRQLAIRLTLWARDCRGGAGEREIFRNLYINLTEGEQIALIDKVTEIGRWDDLLSAFYMGSTKVQEVIAEKWLNAIMSGNGLAAKWCPRKGADAVLLRSYWEMTPKQYRKTLVNATKVVETQMCAKDWDNINFAHVPSVAAARYNKAFYKNALGAYTAYKEALVKGETKINASAIFPHDVVRAAKTYGTDKDIINEQWKALPNYLGDNPNDILVMSDVSGSMECPVSGSVTAMDISVALGLYISERQTGAYKDLVLTFSESPAFHKVQGKGIASRINNLSNANWGGSTNINAAFNLILNVAKDNNVPAADMPKYLLIISDMEFDSCVGSGRYHKQVTNYQAAQKMYSDAGYEMPKVVFWNVNSRTQNMPVRHNEEGVALISGFSPAIMTSVLKAEKFTPESIMLEAVMIARYDVEGVTI